MNREAPTYEQTRAITEEEPAVTEYNWEVSTSVEFAEEFPDEHSHVPDFVSSGGVFGANVHACDSEGRHYHLQVRITSEGVLFDVWDRYGEEILATFARTFDELVEFVSDNDPMNK